VFPIHVPTILAFSTLLSASLGALLLWLWRRDRSQPALASWGAARLLGAAAMPLLAARGLIPDWASINLANAVICTGYGLTWGGARQFEDQPARPAVILAGPAVWLLACELPAFYASLPARIALIALILAAYNGAAAAEFHRGQRRAPLPSRPILVVLLAGAAVIYGACGLLPLMFPLKQGGSGLPASLWFALLVSLGVGLMACTAILLVALTKERAELRSNAALAAVRDIATEANEQKTRFLARMSHELRTPLNGVLGLAQVLARDPEQNDRQRRQAATLEKAGRHLLAILNEVLDLSRMEAGRLELSPRAVAVAEFLRETVALVHGTAVLKGLTFSPVMAPDLPDTVLADPIRLRQILLNLLNNALKFTPAGGSVILTVARGSGKALCFTVADTGPGVPVALRPGLFQDYTQAPGDNAAGGAGLGLAISARLARAMGGDLTHTDGAGGVGSRFALVLSLPVVEAPVGESGAGLVVIQPSVPPRGLRVLVVDDVGLNRMTARALLEHAGHVVEDVVDGHAALAALARRPLPDIILMDQSMPGMDGYTTARHIRALAGRAGRLPILAVTANALPEDIAASLAAGMDGHVAKPIELKALLAAIADALVRAAARQHPAAQFAAVSA
jgi:signal transduction histidine kinase/AmiR/NasT family two-component response regulator